MSQLAITTKSLATNPEDQAKWFTRLMPFAAVVSAVGGLALSSGPLESFVSVAAGLGMLTLWLWLTQTWITTLDGVRRVRVAEESKSLQEQLSKGGWTVSEPELRASMAEVLQGAPTSSVTAMSNAGVGELHVELTDDRIRVLDGARA